jgi:hypothetical protein
MFLKLFLNRFGSQMLYFHFKIYICNVLLKMVKFIWWKTFGNVANKSNTLLFCRNLLCRKLQQVSEYGPWRDSSPDRDCDGHWATPPGNVCMSLFSCMYYIGAYKLIKATSANPDYLPKLNNCHDVLWHFENNIFKKYIYFVANAFISPLQHTNNAY